MAEQSRKKVSQECPLCEESWDDLGQQQALEEIGRNPKSGTLYRCHCCNSRVSQDEIEAGKTSAELVKEGYYDQ